MNQIEQISKIRDKDTLRAIIEAAQKRLTQLESERGEVRIVCHQNKWYAILPDTTGAKRGIDLGERLTPAAILRRAREKPPTAADYEISKPEAVKRQQTERENVGWFEDNTGKRRYYDVPKYDAARSAWHRWKDLANDPIAMSFGISVNGMKQIRRLEEKGYKINFDD